MNDTTSVFRNEALQRYIQQREDSVLPRFINPRFFTLLWLAIVLFMIAGGFAWSAQLPTYATGHGIIVEGASGLEMLVFIPAASSAISVDDAFWITTADGNRVEQTVTAFHSTVQSPQQIYQQYQSIAPIVVDLVQQPVVVATLDVAAEQDPTWLGSQYTVDIENGTQRLVSLLPFIGQFFQDAS